MSPGIYSRADLCFLSHADQSPWTLKDSSTVASTVFQDYRRGTVARTEKQGSLKLVAAAPIIKRKRTALYPAAGQAETPGKKRMRQGPG